MDKRTIKIRFWSIELWDTFVLKLTAILNITFTIVSDWHVLMVFLAISDYIFYVHQITLKIIENWPI